MTSQGATVMTRSHTRPGPRPTPAVRGRWLLLARLGWVALALLSLSVVVSGLPGRYPQATLYWFANDPPPAIVREGLTHLGLTPTLYAGYAFTLYLARAVVCYLMSAVLFWRKSADRMALLVAYFLVAIPGGDTEPPLLHALAAAHPARAAGGMVLGTVSFTLLLWLFFIFPDGQFRPRWTRPVAAIWLTIGVGTIFSPGSPLDMFGWPLLFFAGYFPAVWAIAIYAQVWRYRRISGAVERQQAKWFALGLTIALGALAGLNALGTYTRVAWPTASPTRAVLVDLLGLSFQNLALTTVPLTLAVAMLRYRLWGLDVLINRALVYGSLSALLVTVYFGGVALVEGLLRSAIGQTSSVAVAASTLAIAALFRPLRHRLQVAVDRRFYRRKYDATRTLAAFGATLRDETDLDRIQAGLLTAVEETLQPAHASLWLRSPDMSAH